MNEIWIYIWGCDTSYYQGADLLATYGWDLSVRLHYITLTLKI